jgi:Ala-tRNA(Pro) deacylase
MLVEKLSRFLDDRSVKYGIISHAAANTAQRTAATAHIRGKDLAKTVIVKADGKMIMAVLPASCRVDFALLKEAIGAGAVSLVSEEGFANLFPDCEPGAMPPFGNLYEMDVLLDERLAGNKEIAFNAGSHTELVRMAYKDFEGLVKPKMIKRFAVGQH